MGKLLEKIKGKLDSTRSQLATLAKKANLTEKPKNLGELRAHEQAKVNKHAAGKFHFYLLSKTDGLPVLLVSSDVNKDIDPDYKKLANPEMDKNTGGQAFGTYTIGKEKDARFTLDKATKSGDAQTYANILIQDEDAKNALEAALRYCGGWSLPEDMRIFWGPEQLGEKFSSEILFKSPNVWPEFGRGSIHSMVPDGAFAVLVQEFKKAPTKEKAVALYDHFCVEDTSKLCVNADQALAPRNKALVTAITGVKNGTVKTPAGNMFDSVVDGCSNGSASDGGLLSLTAKFDPKKKLAEQASLEGSGKINVNLAATWVKDTWEPARKQLEAAGFALAKTIK